MGRQEFVSVLARRDLLALVAVIGWVRPAGAADTAAIQTPIAALNAALLAAMKAGKRTPFKQRFDALAPAIDGALDLAAILKTSVGSSWAGLPTAQQAALATVFAKFTVASYAANFDNFDGQRFDVLPALREAGSEEIVQTRLVPTSGDATVLDYVMRQGDKGWRAVDVLLDGSISRVAVQRSDFRALVRGGNASALIDSLQKKVTDLSGGAVS